MAPAIATTEPHNTFSFRLRVTGALDLDNSGRPRTAMPFDADAGFRAAIRAWP